MIFIHLLRGTNQNFFIPGSRWIINYLNIFISFRDGNLRTSNVIKCKKWENRLKHLQFERRWYIKVYRFIVLLKMIDWARLKGKFQGLKRSQIINLALSQTSANFSTEAVVLHLLSQVYSNIVYFLFIWREVSGCKRYGRLKDCN